MKKVATTSIRIFEDTPEVIRDISLLKILLTPLQLYTLKYFLREEHPLNIREVYRETISTIFNYIFFKEEVDEVNHKGIEVAIKDLIRAGYVGTIVSNKEADKVGRSISSKKETLSDTEVSVQQIKFLQKHKARYPSYEKFQNIFKKFEILGVIYKSQKEGKITYYGLNTHFYKIVKNKISEIKNL